MNTENVNRASSAVTGFIVASLIFIALAVAVKFAVRVPAIDADRNAVRAMALAAIRATEDKSLPPAGWIAQSRGIVRLPIDTADNRKPWDDYKQLLSELELYDPAL